MDSFDDDGRPVDQKGNPAEIKYRKRVRRKVGEDEKIIRVSRGALRGRGLTGAFEMTKGATK
jgi:hypothetical protein